MLKRLVSAIAFAALALFVTTVPVLAYGSDTPVVPIVHTITECR